MKTGVTGALALAALASGAVFTGEARADAAERRTQIEKMRDGLNDPDPIVRLITLEEVAASDDVMIRNLALRQAIGIADPDLQALAARMFFSTISTFSLSLKDAKVTGGDATKAKPILNKLSQATLNFQIKDFDPKNGAFQTRFQDSGNFNDGQVTGVTVTFQTYWPNLADCRTTLRIGDALDLWGTILCVDGDLAVTANVSRGFY